MATNGSKPSPSRPSYRGQCHCGAIRFEFEALIDSVEVCNCSLCAKVGYLHIYVPPENFRVLTGPEAIETYQFGTRVAKHYFCKTCGVSPYRIARSDPNKFDVNLRCVEIEDLDSISVTHFDGINWEEAIKER